MKKLISVLLILLSLVLIMSACGLSSMEKISSAFGKTDAATSFNFTIDGSGQFTITGMDDTLSALGMTSDQLQGILNQMTFSYGGSMVKDKSSGDTSAKFNMNVSVAGQNIVLNMWEKLSADGSGQLIMQNPQIPGADLAEKEYTVNNKKAGSITQDNALATKILNDFITENAKDEKFITKVDDKHFKIHVDKDKCVTLLNSIFDALNTSASSELSSSGVSMDQIKTIMPMLLGDKGIDVVMTIGSDGYVSDETMNIDMNLDIAQIAQAMGQSADGIQGTIGVNLKLDMKYSDYNKVDKIDFPEVNADNATINN